MAEWKAATGATEGSPPNRPEGPLKVSEPEFVTIKDWSGADTIISSREFWSRLPKNMYPGEWALKRQIEGAIPTEAPGAAGSDKLPPDLNLSHPWSQSEAQAYTRAMVEHGTKDFHAVQVKEAPRIR